MKNEMGGHVAKKWVGGEVAKQEAATSVPAPARIYRDPPNARWQATYVSNGRRASKSFSWS
eukprot:2039127-Pyramimonas_sp.AAC.1